MNTTNDTSRIGEARVVYEAVQRGYKVAIPQGHDWSYDLIVERHEQLERVQVKTTTSNGEIVPVRFYSTKKHVKGKKKSVPYSEKDFDWFVVFDVTTDACYFLTSKEAKQISHLRLVPPKNNIKRVHWAKDFLDW